MYIIAALFRFVKYIHVVSVIRKVEETVGFTLIRHRLRRCHLPPLGGRLIGATIETTVQFSKCQCSSLPPHGGRWLAEGQTDEGEAEGLHNFTNQRCSVDYPLG